MRRTFCSVLAAGTLALTLVTARGEQAPNGPILPLNQPLTFRYTDAQGMGRITLTDLGPDTATGGDQIRVSIVQKGTHYDGSGIILNVSTERPFTTLITFSVSGPRGRSYFYHGKMGLGVEYQGQGTYHPVRDVSHKLDWGFIALPVR